LLTVMVTGADSAVLPLMSRASAVRGWGPLAIVGCVRGARWGGVVSSAPRGLLSTGNCTPATPASSVALAVMVTVPETVPVGAVIDTVGAVVSPPPVVAALKVAICMTQAPLTDAVAL